MESINDVMRDYITIESDSAYWRWRPSDEEELDDFGRSWFRRSDGIELVYESVPKRKRERRSDELKVTETPELDSFLSAFGISEVSE